MLQRKERNHFTLSQLVGACQTKVQVIAGLVQRYGLQTKFGGAVFSFRERLRVNDVQANLAISLTLVFLQHLLDALGIVAQRHILFTGLIGKEEIQINWLFQVSQNLLSTIGKGIQLLLGKIDTRARQKHVGGHIEGNKSQQQHQ